MSEKRYVTRYLSDVRSQQHPFGRLWELTTHADSPAISVAYVEMRDDHRHRNGETEVYFILEGEGCMTIDNEMIDLRPGTTVLLYPGAVHRATAYPGMPLRALVVCAPAFDPATLVKG